METSINRSKLVYDAVTLLNTYGFSQIWINPHSFNSKAFHLIFCQTETS